MAATKYSHQREAIIHFLKSRKDHPTAEVIYQNLKSEHPTLSLATVYRNLTKLSNDGIILKINCNDVSDHFDGNPEPHAHFICNCCHNISDLTIRTLSFESVCQENHFNGIIQDSQVLFYGTCANCLQN